MATDLTQYFKDGYKLKIEHYLLINDEGDELVIQVDHKKTYNNSVTTNGLLAQLKKKPKTTDDSPTNTMELVDFLKKK
jgi:hypothetical protein